MVDTYLEILEESKKYRELQVAALRYKTIMEDSGTLYPDDRGDWHSYPKTGSAWGDDLDDARKTLFGLIEKNS